MSEAEAAIEHIAEPRTGLYKISRASGCSWEPPCDNAFEATVVCIDRRMCDDPKKIPCNHGTDGDWYTEGTDHRIENGQICRTLGTRREWFVVIPDLMEFADKEGELIVGRDANGFGYVKIYDDMIE